jgi:hypothetical protein
MGRNRLRLRAIFTQRFPTLWAAFTVATTPDFAAFGSFIASSHGKCIFF